MISRTNILDHRANSWLVLAGRPFNAMASNANNRINVRNYLTEGDHGTYRAGQPGPVRVGQIFTAQEATYSGLVTKDQMTLSVTLADGTALGPFQLTYGVRGTLNRCL